jgi:type IX secretion system PorP/SprF family membrane protein
MPPYCGKIFIMGKMKFISMIVFAIQLVHIAYGQDPSFSQFFSSPLNINPALTAKTNTDWRLIANFRDQWVGPASPYVTGTISYDSKILQNDFANAPEKNNYMGIGGMLMYDNAMSGAIKSTYASFNLSYNMKLAGEGDTGHQLGIGFGAIYGRRYTDFTALDFEEQFTGAGFNKNLPTGESALSNMKPYMSLSTGLLYSYNTEKTNVDMGIGAFHVNKPRQTFLGDENQRLPMRKVAHANVETFLNQRVVLSTNAIYQFQMEAKYFSVGGALGYYLNDADETLINAGLWYWSDNAIVPYIGLTYKNIQYGLSYDITISKLNQGARKPSTAEFSIILRGNKAPSGAIPCPWK